ncbi:hypothetical protein CXG81DRAFT_27784 [Caulochytrium protostelioides]|uniref:Uncharacterized protein n=1 Tax=Caulochytrium protostelioides TaxID=1555241 RepID=A0A4P9X372_9FUNG|nr:hypothetical protein CXG81DRAFT_27784 [Caulochytrium protostelioides]|eukprot:RKO99465.1 hypothetical protein CXG81DRAFT_27784 [Caulochytrium protostelioides]
MARRRPSAASVTASHRQGRPLTVPTSPARSALPAAAAPSRPVAPAGASATTGTKGTSAGPGPGTATNAATTIAAAAPIVLAASSLLSPPPSPRPMSATMPAATAPAPSAPSTETPSPPPPPPSPPSQTGKTPSAAVVTPSPLSHTAPATPPQPQDTPRKASHAGMAKPASKAKQGAASTKSSMPASSPGPEQAEHGHRTNKERMEEFAQEVPHIVRPIGYDVITCFLHVFLIDWALLYRVLVPRFLTAAPVLDDRPVTTPWPNTTEIIDYATYVRLAQSLFLVVAGMLRLTNKTWERHWLLYGGFPMNTLVWLPLWLSRDMSFPARVTWRAFLADRHVGRLAAATWSLAAVPLTTSGWLTARRITSWCVFLFIRQNYMAVIHLEQALSLQLRESPATQTAYWCWTHASGLLAAYAWLRGWPGAAGGSAPTAAAAEALTAYAHLPQPDPRWYHALPLLGRVLPGGPGSLYPMEATGLLYMMLATFGITKGYHWMMDFLTFKLQAIIWYKPYEEGLMTEWWDDEYMMGILRS